MEDDENISRKTLSRNIDPVNKIGYMDGAADGQTAAFQSSFNKGYKQGFSFGMELGMKQSLGFQKGNVFNDQNELPDPRKINCQLCINGTSSEQNVVNLFNIQQEKNADLLK